MSNKKIYWVFIILFIGISILGYQFEVMISNKRSYLINELKRESIPFGYNVKFFGKLVDSVTNIRNLSKEDNTVLKTRVNTLSTKITQDAIKLNVISTKIEKLDIINYVIFILMSISLFGITIGFLDLDNIQKENHDNKII